MNSEIKKDLTNKLAKKKVRGGYSRAVEQGIQSGKDMMSGEKLSETWMKRGGNNKLCAVKRRNDEYNSE